ncbi:MAG: tetratricopeptide repeat protein, partial [Bdellovibrionales bacterium]|nr:tetratricopeptide repeat protein [Bdellovibrionales bacterium]
ALFFSGYAATELGREAEGLKILEEFAAKYPGDAHAPDAFRVLADARFDRNDFAGAEGWYRRIFSFSDSPVLGYAFYKTAWCAYNRKDFARALLALEKAVVWSMDTQDQSQGINLAREARRDLVALYAEVGDHRRAYDYFTQFLRGDPREWLSELAKEMDRNGQYEKSAEIHKLIVSLNPSDPAGVLHQASVIWGAYHLRRWPEAADALQVLADKFSGETAAQAKGTPAASAEELVREAALAREFEYRKAPSEASAESVERVYSLYLRAFGAWETSQEPRFRYALFLRGRGKNAEAEAELRRHWEQFSAVLKEPAREEAFRNWIDVIRDLDRPEDREKLLQQAEAYRKAYPKTKHARSVAFLVPATQFKLGRAEDAIRESQALFDLDPSDEIGKLCFKNLRVAYYERKNWAAARLWAGRLLDRSGPALKAYRDDLQLIHEETSFLEAQTAATPAEQAALYAGVAKRSPRLRDKSVVNGFLAFKAAGQNLAALELAESGGKGAQSISGIRAALYQEAGDYARALPLLEEFLKSPEGKESAEEARRNIALIRDASVARPAGAEKKGSLAPALLAKKARVERGLIGTKGDLAKQMEKGTADFQAVAEEFLAAARDTAPEVAYEAYCAVPLLYRSQAQAVRAVAARPEFAKEREALAAELEKIALPLEGKAAEFASECLAKTEEIGTAGRFYGEVAGIWGGEERARRIRAGAELLGRLAAQSPWLEGAAVGSSEADLLRLHLEGKGDASSWHALALHRFRAKSVGLARLTAADGLSHFPQHGPLWNVLGAAQHALGRQQEAEAAFRKGAEAGSSHASVNLGLLELRRGRIEAARSALSRGGFQGATELERLVEEFLKR